MAINPNVEYAGRVTAPNADYPYASSKNETSPGAGDGTPYELARANDIFGFQQAILSEAGIVPSGNADTALLSEYLNGLKTILRSNSINGLMISNAADADHDITVAIGNAMDSDNDFLLNLSATITKQIDAVWAAGDNAGGLFSGSVAIDTWYHLFLIRKDSDGSIDAGFDTSVIAANIPAGYTAFRRIGSVLTDGSANILPFIQMGNRFSWVDIQSDYSASPSSGSRDTVTLSTPLGVKTIAILGASAAANSAGNDFMLMTDLDMTDVAAGSNSFSCISSSSGIKGATRVDIVTNTSSQIGIRANEAAVPSIIITFGWLDDRGQN